MIVLTLIFKAVHLTLVFAKSEKLHTLVIHLSLFCVYFTFSI